MKRIVLVGGGHAHLESLVSLGEMVDRGHEVTVVSPTDYQYYSGMGPGLLSQTYRVQDVRFNIRSLAERAGALFVRDRVIEIDTRRRVLHLAGGEAVPYDLVSLNIGSAVPLEGLVPVRPMAAVVPVKPIDRLVQLRRDVLEVPRETTAHLVVIGGGPAGVEVAGNLRALCDHHEMHHRITLVAGRRLLERAPEKVHRLALASLQSRGVTVLEGCFADRVHEGLVRLSDGRSLAFDLAVVATGVTPGPLVGRSGLPVDDDGAMRVNRCLQSVAHPEILGGGDCVSVEGVSLNRVGVHAVDQGPVLKHNLLALASGGSLKRFKPRRRYALIMNMGDRRGIAWRGRWAFGGRLAFWLKNWIDQRFMKRYQRCHERMEPAGVE